jgi:formylglycine-generating enzyme required for sulfatase activity
MLAALGLFLPRLLSFVGANSDLIQGIADLVQLLLWLGAGILTLLGYRRRRKGRSPSKVKTSGGASVGGDVSVAAGDFIGHDQNVIITRSADDILKALRPSMSPEALQGATESYLHYLLDRHRYLNVKGMGVSDRVPLRLPLLDLYVPLKARLTLPEGETWQRDLQLAGRRLSEEEQERLTGRLGEPQPVLDLLHRHDGLIILGDPGAGKTTFLKVLALRLALGEGDALGLGHRLPVLVPLSAYANALAGDDVRLDDFIADYFRDIGADLPITPMLEEAFESGTALILLDGLDEVKDPARRHTVIERVVDFYTLHRRQGNAFVLTSRIVGYRQVRPTAAGLAECTLVDFEEAEIEAFVDRWTRALERQALGESAVARADAERERRELLDAIQRNPGVRRLAANPLLLTILALMKRQGVMLPERRVELYERYVRTMLSSWNRARGLGRPPTRDLDVVQTVRVLAPLALWMHETNPGVGLVKREALRRHLEGVFAEQGAEEPEAAARRFLADVREHAGLLLERGPGQYGFIHLTFEEYLAAMAIALRGQGDCRRIVDTLSEHVGDPAWREVSLLTVPYLGIIQQLDRVAGEVVEALVAEQPGEPGEAVVLAGQATLDAGETGVPARSRRQVTEALVGAMQGAAVEPALRRDAGLILGRLGWRPGDVDALVEVPPGPFLYGDEKEEREIAHHYWIGKYAVANCQYERFIEDDGYQREALWSEEGWAWRERNEREQPSYWDDADFSNAIFPVVGVTWYEAQAYCRWLTEALRMPRCAFQVWRDDRLERLSYEPEALIVRLPSEEEWERAARGTDGRAYPWGDVFDRSKANVREEKLIGTTAVSTYPQGVSPVGAWDMSGNVWEWTEPLHEPSTERFVLRGGSWGGDQGDARCAFRLRLIPVDFFINVGFRVVVSLVDAGC